MSEQTLSFTQQVKAPAEVVYRAFTNATALREWLCDVATVSPHPGGRLYLWWTSGFYTSGSFTQAEEGKKVAFTWFGRGEPAVTQVQVNFTPQDDGTLVTLAHSGIGSGEEWSQSTVEIEKGWENSLKNLVSVLETGEDQRFVMRPMLGIMLNDFNAKIAEQLGVPVSKGIRLSGTVDGMKAGEAGLQEDDIIVGMAGVEILDFDSIEKALSGYRAGDEIEVEFYRGSEKKSVMMELSKRPLPDIPASAKELANQVRTRYQEIEIQLDEFLEGVSEEEADFKSAPDTWSLKDNLAHLIQGERFNHIFIVELVGGHERFADDYGGNIDEFNQATIATFPTIQDLVQEYKRSMDETVQILIHLPNEFMARKGSYWRLAYNFLEQPYHFYLHLDQMKATIEEARKS
jgi:uncharacterized protein YndB with AHSA1/START domain